MPKKIKNNNKNEIIKQSHSLIQHLKKDIEDLIKTVEFYREENQNLRKILEAKSTKLFNIFSKPVLITIIFIAIFISIYFLPEKLGQLLKAFSTFK